MNTFEEATTAGSHAELAHGETVGLVEASVEQYRAAVFLLHSKLAHEIGRRQQLERDYGVARTEVALARAELLDMLVGDSCAGRQGRLATTDQK